MDSDIILVIDEGTTSTRAIAFDRAFNEVGMAQSEIGLSYPKDGWVEQDPAAIWSQTVDVCRSVIDTIGGADRIAGIGITNQRETSIIWDRETGTPIAPAIIWQDRRTSAFCESLKADGHEATVQSETGLLLDPYFSGSKIRWLLDNTPGARDAAKVGKLAFGTVDSWLIWNLTSGKVHATDVTNAARTLL
ncbi:MAG: FGGY family carbohydrate kinase, partial [Pseudomonadota bacterium]